MTWNTFLEEHACDVTPEHAPPSPPQMDSYSLGPTQFIPSASSGGTSSS